MTRIKLLLCSAFALFHFTEIAYGQLDSLLYSEKIYRYRDLMSLKLDATSSAERFNVNSGSQTTEIRPNAGVVNHIRFNYRLLSFSYKLMIPSIPGNNDADTKGESSSNGFGLSFNPGQWTTDFSWSRVKGYYLNNTSDFDPTWQDGDPYILFPDLRTSIFRLTLARAMNPGFSLNAALLQTERQLFSQGTFLPNIRLTYFDIDDQIEFTGTNSSQRSKMIESIFSLGYAHTFTIWKYTYLTADFRPGVGFLREKLQTRLPQGNFINNNTYFTYGFNADIQLGYNGRKFFAGVTGSFGHYEHQAPETDNYKVGDERLTWQVFLGLRIKAPEKLKKSFDVLESQIAQRLIGKK